MKYLFRYMRCYRAQAILGPLFKLLEAMFELFVPLVVASIIDTGIAGQNTGYVVQRFGLLVALGVIGFVCSITAQYFAARAAVGSVGKLRHALFAQIERLSFSNLDSIGVPTLLTRLTGDMTQIQNGVNLTLRLLLRSPFVVFGATIMAFTLHVRTGWIFLAVIAVLSVIVFGIMLGSVPAYRKVQQEQDAVTERTRENLVGARVIRAFQMEDGEEKKFSEHNNTLNQRQQFAGQISALMNPMTFVILNVGLIVLLNVSGGYVHTGILTTGQVIALYNYMMQILVELIKFANLLINISKSISCMKRVGEILDTEPAMHFPETEPMEKTDAPAIEFRGVTLRYTENADPALTDVQFAVRRGETIGIIGGTGSGKTSLVSLLLRFYDVEKGEVLVNGVPVQEYPADTLRQKIGYVLQRPSLFKGDIRGNLQFGQTAATDREMREALRLAQASDVLETKGNSLAADVEQEGRNFSGGQRQRLTIARALIRKPEILILDDSSSALDFATDAALRQELASLSYHPTVLLVSQRTASIRHADRILVLEDGKLVGSGTHAELLQTCSVYREIDESQYKKEA